MSNTTDTIRFAPKDLHEPWQDDHFPAVMSLLDEELREYAIKSANAFKAVGHPPEDAISHGISMAWDWDHFGRTHAIEAKPPGPAHRIESVMGEWHLSSELQDEDVMVFPTLETALDRGHELAKERNGALYVYVDDKLTDKYVFFASIATNAPIVYHLSPEGDGWCVNRVSSRDSHHKHFDTKKEALDHARDIAKENKAMLVIYSKDGDRQREHDYRVS